MLYALFLNLFFAGIKTLSIGALDLIEFKYFNSEVFKIHNFPDIVPHMRPGGLAAFASGVYVSWFLFFPLSLVWTAIGLPAQNLFFVTFFEFAACFLCMVKNKVVGNHGIDGNHKDFYFCYTTYEVLTICYHLYTIL